MPDITGNLLIDLDDSGSFSTDLCASTGLFTSGFWKIENGFSLRGRGRKEELDAAGMASMVIRLDNADGRFSPLNSSSPYQSGGVNRFRPYKQAHVKLSFNAVTYDQIKGVITDIKIGPESGDQLCEITIRDFMFVLSRTEIRRPLMLNQYTGVIIHCLLDDVEGAEGREACTNTSFGRDLTGWTTFGTAVNTRMTADANEGKILEGPGAMRTVTSAINSGARHTMTGHNGLKKTLAVYVKPERDADIGATVQVKMVDNVGTVTTGAATAMASRDYWTRLEVNGTYNGGSTSQFIDIQAPASGTQFRVGKAHCVPFVNAFAREIDDGKARIQKYAYNRGPALQAVQEVRENELGALFFFDGAGQAIFQDKHYRFGLTGAAGSFNERGVLDYQESGDDRIKAVILDYPHYVDGVAGTEMYSLDRVISIAPSKTERVEADYQGGLAKDTTTPVANTHYTITFAADGAGGDATGSVAFTFDDYGGASVGTFVNNHASKMVYLRTYRVLATPIRLASDRTPARYTPAGGPALAATLSHDFQLNGSEPDIQAWAEYLGDRYATQRQRLTLSLSAAFPEAVVATSDMVQILARTVSERVAIVNDNLPFATFVSDTFYIDSIDLWLQSNGEISSLHARWRLSPVDEPYYVIGEELFGGELMAA